MLGTGRTHGGSLHRVRVPGTGLTGRGTGGGAEPTRPTQETLGGVGHTWIHTGHMTDYCSEWLSHSFIPSSNLKLLVHKMNTRFHDGVHLLSGCSSAAQVSPSSLPPGFLWFSSKGCSYQTLDLPKATTKPAKQRFPMMLQ